MRVCFCCDTSGDCRTKNWQRCSRLKKTTWRSGSIGSASGCKSKCNARRSEMSEDFLDRALDEMKAENVDAAALEVARARVFKALETLPAGGSAACAEFRQDLRAYLVNDLSAGRRTLAEDHLSRCPGCRAALADLKGERRVIAMPQRSSRWAAGSRSLAYAAAAVLLISIAYLGRGTLDAMMAPGGPRATVVSANGGVYRLAEARSA